jgi:hypothetical protein
MKSMYGFATYGTTEYASRPAFATLGPVVSTPTITLRLGNRTPFLQPLQIVQNDYGYEIPFVLQDSLGNPVNLSGARLVLEVQSAQDPTHTLVTLDGSITIDSASGGTCHYAVANGDFSNPGTLLAQPSLVYGNETLSWGGLQLIVMPTLPKTIN